METHPITLLAAEIAATSLIVGFTSPSSIIRPAGLPLIAILTWMNITRSTPRMGRSAWGAMVGGYAVSQMFHYIDIAILSRWNFGSKSPKPIAGLESNAPKDVKSNGKPSQMEPKDTLFERIKFGISTTLSFRFSTTPYAIKNIPPFSSTDPTYIPTRPQFLLRTVITAILSYIVLDFLASSADPEVAAVYFSLSKIHFFTRLREITAQEITMRVFSMLGLAVSMCCVQRGMYSMFGFVAVGLGISEPRDWPPFYGPLSKAYSLRNSWRLVWHQTNTRKLNSISKFLTSPLPSSPSTRYFQNFLVFLSSGIMHLLIDIASGLPPSKSGAIHFFLTQFFGIVVEDLFIQSYKLLFVKEEREMKTWGRVMGYVWVVCFASWSNPVYMYPIVQMSKGGLEDSVVPWSLFMKAQAGNGTAAAIEGAGAALGI